LTLVIVICLSFVIFLMLAYSGRVPVVHRSLQQFSLRPSLGMASILITAYIAGAWGWIVVFTMRRSGVHRLAEVRTYMGRS
jgi:hypothetical protein